MPQVSVIIPTYNRAHFVTVAIDSVLAQSYTDYEIIVIDDGSTDNTQEALQAYGDKIRYIYQSNNGAGAARNTGIRAASADLVAFLDSDDKWMPRKLELQMPLMCDANVVLSYTNWEYIDSSGHRLPTFDTKIKPAQTLNAVSIIAQLDGPVVLLGTCIIRRSALGRVGLLDERMRVAEDTRLLYRLMFEGCFAACAEVLYEVNLDEARPCRLTRQDDEGYQLENVSAGIEILMEAYARARAFELPEAALFRRKLARKLALQALSFAKAGSYASARRSGFEALVFGAKGYRLRAAAVLFCPRLYANFIQVRKRFSRST